MKILMSEKEFNLDFKENIEFTRGKKNNNILSKKNWRASIYRVIHHW